MELIGAGVVGSMVILYALETRWRAAALGFAVSCVAASLYAVAIRSWPFAVVEAIWALIALHRWHGSRPAAAQDVPDIPIACTLGALSEEERQVRSRSIETLHAHALESKETPRGYLVGLPDERGVLVAALDLMRFERRCCPFLSFTVDVNGGEGPTWLHLTGPKGTRDFLKAELKARRGVGGKVTPVSGHRHDERKPSRSA